MTENFELRVREALHRAADVEEPSARLASIVENRLQSLSSGTQPTPVPWLRRFRVAIVSGVALAAAILLVCATPLILTTNLPVSALPNCDAVRPAPGQLRYC